MQALFAKYAFLEKLKKFEVRYGLRQENALSLTLLHLVLENIIIDNIQENQEVNVLGD